MATTAAAKLNNATTILGITRVLKMTSHLFKSKECSKSSRMCSNVGGLSLAGSFNFLRSTLSSGLRPTAPVQRLFIPGSLAHDQNVCLCQIDCSLRILALFVSLANEC